MLIVGLTGGIASGKSLVAGVFQSLGAHIIDADQLVHELLEPDQQAWHEVVEHFGKEILHPDKSIDRRKLGEIVFSDSEKRKWLNSCLHPKVFESYCAQVKRINTHEPDSIVVFDAALLIESGFHRNMDRTVVVYADENQQRIRLMERNSLTGEQAVARIRSQMPLSEKRAFSDYIVNNTGQREKTELEAREVFIKLKKEGERT
ncbi:MAG TPA: dephospho-CoA kinase [Nitrospiraceae bacterium]|nr:dephospho-CoA kinase [Nitrospiraceae bacterium]